MTMPRTPQTVIGRIWDAHVVARPRPGQALLAIDRVFLHERTGPALLAGLAAAGRKPRHPQRVWGVVDHIVDTSALRSRHRAQAYGQNFIDEFRQRTAAAGLRVFDVDDPAQGIVHVVSPEQGLALPGLTLVCPDSHTGTVGGLGALAWGIGSTEGEHAVATGTLLRPEPLCMQVRLDGVLPEGVTAKDMALALIARFGASGGAPGGQGHAIEFAGAAVRALGIEARLTLCNMAVEFGAWTGLVAPDDSTAQWVQGRAHAPVGAAWDAALAHWRTLRSDDDAPWDARLTLDVSALAPQVTWGTTPEHAVDITGQVPDPALQNDPTRARAWEAALRYMGLQPGQPLAGTPIDAAFIGSCTNSRLSDLRAAAAVARGRKVAPGVRALVVPGSTPVRAAAEAEGLHRVFEEAGFEWRASGCSLCFFSGADSFGFAPGSSQRVVSSTNRNFEGRQGPGVRTHLASPATVVASAIAGCIADPRPYLNS
jgi:3-isopropylmalate/(R)-2-methylmalate dehydratase large subunit